MKPKKIISVILSLISIFLSFPVSVTASTAVVTPTKGYAIKADDSLWFWDIDQTGRCSDPTKIMDDVDSIQTIDSVAYVIKTDGSLWVWTDESVSQQISPPRKIMDGVESIKSIDYISYVLKTDGSLWTFYVNWRLVSDLDDNDGNIDDFIVTEKIMDGVADFSLYIDWSVFMAIYVVKTDGSLWVSKVNDYLDWTKIMDDVVCIKSSIYIIGSAMSQGFHAYAIKKDGSLWCVFATHGENLINEPFKIMDGVESVYADDMFVYAIKKDGSLWGDSLWGLGKNEPFKVTDGVAAMEIATWRPGTRGDLDCYSANFVLKRDGSLWSQGVYWLRGEDIIKSELTKILDNAVYLAGTGAITVDGSLWVWGSHFKGIRSDEGVEIIPVVPVKIMDGVKMPPHMPPKLRISLGDVLHTDITAYINGNEIPTHNIDGNTFVIAEDLLNYGFDVVWNGAARTLKVELNKGKTFKPLTVEKETVPTGTFKCKYLYTDIKTYLSGKLVKGLNIDGQTLINFDLLAQYGTIAWDGKARELRLVIGGDIKNQAYDLYKRMNRAVSEVKSIDMDMSLGINSNQQKEPLYDFLSGYWEGTQKVTGNMKKAVNGADGGLDIQIKSERFSRSALGGAMPQSITIGYDSYYTGGEYYEISVFDRMRSPSGIKTPMTVEEAMRRTEIDEIVPFDFPVSAITGSEVIDLTGGGKKIKFNLDGDYMPEYKSTLFSEYSSLLSGNILTFNEFTCEAVIDENNMMKSYKMICDVSYTAMAEKDEGRVILDISITVNSYNDVIIDFPSDLDMYNFVKQIEY